MVSFIRVIVALGLGATLPVNAAAVPRKDIAFANSNGKDNGNGNSTIYYNVISPRRMVPSYGVPCGNGPADGYHEDGTMCCSPDASWPPTYCKNFDVCADGPFRNDNGDVVWGCAKRT